LFRSDRYVLGIFCSFRAAEIVRTFESIERNTHSPRRRIANPRPRRPRTVDIPPEVRQLAPPACMDCSARGVLLDAFRYVCSTCWEDTPHPRASSDANGHANRKGKARARTSSSTCRCSTRSRTRRAHMNG
ncbi:hypothetical protein DFH11DRAFT_1609267, partial [Phellopilus nigrolimitatus]